MIICNHYNHKYNQYKHNQFFNLSQQQYQSQPQYQSMDPFSNNNNNNNNYPSSSSTSLSFGSSSSSSSFGSSNYGSLQKEDSRDRKSNVAPKSTGFFGPPPSSPSSFSAPQRRMESEKQDLFLDEDESNSFEKKRSKSKKENSNVDNMVHSLSRNTSMPKAPPQNMDLFSTANETISMLSTKSTSLNPSYSSVFSHQGFDGSFQLSVLSVIGIGQDRANQFAQQNGLSIDKAIVILVLAYLQLKLSHQRDEWLMASMKSERWLQQNGCGHFGSLVGPAMAFF